MTALLEKIVAIIAPHHCFVCGIEDNIVCVSCFDQVFMRPDSACVLCGVVTIDWRLCPACSHQSALSGIVPVTLYKNTARKVLYDFKFERLRAATEPLACALDEALPYFAPDTLVVPMPTAPRRIRQRGYDQTLLLAKEFARLRGLRIIQPLRRVHDLRQLGQTRSQRFTQAETAYELKNNQYVHGKSVVLIDDVCTTGASLGSAAHVLQAAGVTNIWAGVVAWQNKK